MLLSLSLFLVCFIGICLNLLRNKRSKSSSRVFPFILINHPFDHPSSIHIKHVNWRRKLVLSILFVNPCLKKENHPHRMESIPIQTFHHRRHQLHQSEVHSRWLFKTNKRLKSLSLLILITNPYVIMSIMLILNLNLVLFTYYLLLMASQEKIPTCT